MSQVGSAPAQIIRVTNTTIAASAGGTAAATAVATVSAVAVRAWEVFNLSGLNLEIVIGKDALSGTDGACFVPNTTLGTTMANRAPIALTAGVVIKVRTTLTTPATIASTNPIFINLWA